MRRRVVADVPRVNRYDKVRVFADGPDVCLIMPKREAKAHWHEMRAVAEAIFTKSIEAERWEKGNV